MELINERRFGSHIAAPAKGPGGAQSEDQLELIPAVSWIWQYISVKEIVL